MHAKTFEFSATDIANFLACPHLLTLDQAEKAGEITRPFRYDPGVELLRKLGIQHEQTYLRYLTESPGLRVVHIPTDIAWAEAVARTIAEIRAGADAVYQATFQDGVWRGRADFLIRVNRPSELGDFSYEVVETKLARSAKVRAILQLCFYSELLAKIQDLQPEWMHVALGGGTKPERFLVSRYAAYFRKVKRDFEEAMKSSRKTYPEPVELCDVCSWYPLCDKKRRDDDHLSFVAGITRIQRNQLGAREINTLARLADLDLPLVPKIERIGDAALLRVRDQARLQALGRKTGKLIYELLEPVEEEKGLAALPLPSPGDVFLDLEAAPYLPDTGLEYLIGWVTPAHEPGAEPEYHPLWSFEPNAEKEAFEQFIGFVTERRQQYPDLHVYHYAPYEQAAIKRLAGRHGVCVDEVDRLLRGSVFVDLFRIVRQALRASVESYSIKKIEVLYDFIRAMGLREASSALQIFETVLTLGNGQEITQEILQTIAAYNRDDCISALRLRDWLEARRQELEANTGKALPRPAPKSDEPGENLVDRLNRVRLVMARLLEGLPADQSEWTDEQYGRWLLGQLLEWHRREEKSAWWEYFRLCDLSDIELQADKTALGGLSYVGPVGQEKKSIIHRYSFPPQDHAIERARTVHDPRTRKRVGEIVAVDALTIDIKRSASSIAPHPTSLIPHDIVGSDVLRESLLRLGLSVAENGLEGDGPFQAQRDLLLRRTPQVLAKPVEIVIDRNGQFTEGARQLVISLARKASMLPVQGPPGSGKTFTGARMIVELVRQGCRVGITAVSHKVISHLLTEVCMVARKAAVPLKAIQKADETGGCEDSLVKQLDDNKAVLDALENGEAQVAAGTCWLWGREDMRNSVDVLFIDEAGQMSLANVLAASQAATSSVLLGDPQQLDQPQKGVHPPGADGSAFAHLLQDHSTISCEQGLFLTDTHRLHPDTCAFTSELFYEGRLKTRTENVRQRLNAKGPFDGTGLRFMPVEHSGNQNESPEEVEQISSLIDHLRSNGATWTDKEGVTRPLNLKEILVVAPYNAQVAALRQKLPPDARIGTVDKFQGQEAPIVFYSMTTSTPQDAPRGMEFLYSLNRLNVAVSRARCVAVIVASPALFQVECKKPRDIELANAFCRYLEMARVI